MISAQQKSSLPDIAAQEIRYVARLYSEGEEIMKRFCAIILTVVMLFSLGACGKSGTANENGPEQKAPGQNEDQVYAQSRYIQERVIPVGKYERVAGLSASDYGVYINCTFIDNAGVLQIFEQILDNKGKLLKDIKEDEPDETAALGDTWDFPIIARILNDGRLAELRCVVPRIDEENDDWDNTYSVFDIIDLKDGTQQRFAMDAALASAKNKIFYDGQNIGFYSQQAVGVYSTDGRQLGIYKSRNRVDDACFMADGTVAVLEYKQGVEASEDDLGQIFRFDPESGAAEEFMIPPSQGVGLLDAAHDEEYFSFYIADGSGIKGIDPDKQPRDILNWVAAGVTGRAMAMESMSGRRFAYMDMNGAAILKPTDVDMSQVSTLRLGTLDPFPIAGLVAEFNQISENYLIELVDYSKMSSADGSVTGAEQLDIDIISGNGPDIFDLKSLPMKKYQQAGLLVDLYPYMREDKSLSDVKLLQGPLKAMETDGKLYTLAPAYGIRSFVGDPDHTGVEQLDVPAMAELFDRMEDGANPFGVAMSKSGFLDCMLNLSRSQFADWDSLKCGFNDPEFAALLKMAGKLPEQEDISMQSSMMFTGEQMLSMRNILCIEDLIFFNACIHDNMKLYGVPAAPEHGTVMMPLVALGISVNCRDKQGAWEFLSCLLSDTYQKSLCGQALPITQAGIDYIYQDHRDWAAVGGELVTVDPLGMGELCIKITDDRYINMLQNAIDSITAVYNNDSKMMELILRDTQACFSGDISAERAAEQVQSRAGIYMAEQFG